MGKKHENFWRFTPLLAVIASIVTMLVFLMRVMLLPKMFILALFASIGGGLVGLFLGYFYKKRSEPKNIGSLFISHSATDKDLVRRLADDLRRDGYKVMVSDELISVGDIISSKIDSALQKVDGVVAVLSENALKSGWVQKELQAAIDRNLKIYPIVVGEVQLPSMLQDIMYVKVEESYLGAYRALERAIRGSLGYM